MYRPLLIFFMLEGSGHKTSGMYASVTRLIHQQKGNANTKYSVDKSANLSTVVS